MTDIKPHLGQVWTDGMSALLCADMLEIDLPRADLIFSDPPWNQNVLNKFYTLAGLPTSPTFYNFIDASIDKMLETCPTGLIVVQYGRQAASLAKDLFLGKGAQLLGEASYTYSGGIPYHTQIYSRSTSRPFPIPVPPGHQSNNTPIDQWLWERLIADAIALPGKIVLDPFCGECYHLDLLASRGMRFIGVEIIPGKLQKGIRRMLRHAKLHIQES